MYARAYLIFMNVRAWSWHASVPWLIQGFTISKFFSWFLFLGTWRTKDFRELGVSKLDWDLKWKKKSIGKEWTWERDSCRLFWCVVFSFPDQVGANALLKSALYSLTRSSSLLVVFQNKFFFTVAFPMKFFFTLVCLQNKFFTVLQN